MSDARLREAMERLGESMKRAIQAELRRLIREASKSPSRITIEPKEQ